MVILSIGKVLLGICHDVLGVRQGIAQQLLRCSEWSQGGC